MSAAYAKSTVPDEMFLPAREQMETMITQLQSSEMLAAQHGDLEVFVQEQGRELQRRLQQAHLDLRASRERPVPVRGNDGVARTYRRASRRPTRRVRIGRALRRAHRLVVKGPAEVGDNAGCSCGGSTGSARNSRVGHAANLNPCSRSGTVGGIMGGARAPSRFFVVGHAHRAPFVPALRAVTNAARRRA